MLRVQKAHYEFFTPGSTTSGTFPAIYSSWDQKAIARRFASSG